MSFLNPQMKKQKCDPELWKQIDKNMKNPEYVKAVYEFILESTS